MPRPSPFRYFKTIPDVIRVAVMIYIRFPLSLRNVEDLETVQANRTPSSIAARTSMLGTAGQSACVICNNQRRRSGCQRS